MKTYEDSAFEDLDRRQAQGWGKRKVSINQDAEEAFNKWSNSSDLVRKDLHWPPFLAGYKAGKKS